MEAAMKSVRAPNKNIRITKWKVKPGQRVNQGAILCIYETDDAKGLKIKANEVGTICEIMGQEGDRKPPGSVLVTIEPCRHPTVMKDMCAECGADLREEAGMAGERKEPVTATVAMVHSIPELIISEEQAKEIGREDENRLLKTKKLVLLVDLDQTLIHTTNDNIPANLKGVFHYQLRHGYGKMWYHTRIRPGTQHFLETVSKMYELHICTFGVRMYAHTIARYLDPEEKYFSHRILSRDECFNPNSKTANLKALFPCGDKMVAIIDDREDVWNFAPNLIHVKPYRFFQGTADINAPPGLTKTEHDQEPVHHRVRRVSRSKSMEKEDEIEIDDSVKKGDNLQTKNDEEIEKSCVKEDNKVVDSANKDKNKTIPSETSETNQKDVNKKSGSYNENNNKNLENKKEKTEIDNSEPKISDDIKQTENKEKCEEGESLSVVKEIETNPKVQDLEAQNSDMEIDNKKSDIENPKKTQMDDKNSSVKSMDTDKSESANPDDSKTNNESVDNLKEEDVEIEWDDEDDYLLYLEEILTRIHKTFFEFNDQLKSKKNTEEVPDLKNIISYIKIKVLNGVNIVFSGVFPTNMPPEKSRAYLVAKALGANIHTNIIPNDGVEKGMATTHLVAAKLGTNKVRMALKCKTVKIVNANWLWSCAERYEHVDERLFPLDKETSKESRDSPDVSYEKSRKRKSDPDDVSDKSNLEKRLKTGESQESAEASTSQQKSKDTEMTENQNPMFSKTYNPLLAFSDDDLACMDKEVEEIMDDDPDNNSSEDDDERDSRMRLHVLSSGENDSSSQDSLSADLPRGWKKKDRSGSSDSPVVSEKDEPHDIESENDLEHFEKTVDAFAPDTDSDDNASIGSMDDEMAAAIEKEFLEL
ncbi:RNA polymerase II subunit A C-terminal domain phosphatase-like isoform X1 [Mytilus trossulus]|uniref:RNA polymerase II subunit A C-terminal domain phosphatase-like isoform X1 n=3 Tax=Mytilus trossulus TaxID=6551 RepID=UPI003005871D